MRVGIITQYPMGDINDKNLSGVAAFCKYLFEKQESQDVDFTIYANTTENDKVEMEYSHKVKYCWKKGVNPFFKIFKELIKDKRDIIHIQHELFLYGSIMTNLFLFLFILACRIVGMKVIIEFHAVIPLDRLNKEFTEDNRISVSPKIAKICFWIFYKMVSFFCNKVIVHEPIFKKYLINQYGIKKKKINIVPLPCIEPDITYTKEEAREILKIDKHKKVIFYFGYISGYKGLDKLIKASHDFLKNIPDSILYIAGGLHPRMKNDTSYLEFVEKLKNQTVSEKTIWHGYVLDEEIPVLFAAADVMIFPYNVGMSSSGPLSQAIAYEVPFIVSEAFKGIVLEDECIFGKTEDDLQRSIVRFMNDEENQKSIQKYSEKLKKDRNPKKLFKNLVRIYHSV